MWDLIVIGGGPGGCAAALRAAKGGLSVALFEQREVGGHLPQPGVRAHQGPPPWGRA